MLYEHTHGSMTFRIAEKKTVSKTSPLRLMYTLLKGRGPQKLWVLFLAELDVRLKKNCYAIEIKMLCGEAAFTKEFALSILLLMERRRPSNKL